MSRKLRRRKKKKEKKKKKKKKKEKKCNKKKKKKKKNKKKKKKVGCRTFSLDSSFFGGSGFFFYFPFRFDAEPIDAASFASETVRVFIGKKSSRKRSERVNNAGNLGRVLDWPNPMSMTSL